MAVVLIAEIGTARAGRHVLERESTVGRGRENAFVIDSPVVSREHARFLLHEGRVLVSDLNSTSGTYINSRRIAQQTPMNEGDIVQIGNCTIRFESPEAAAKHAAFTPRDAREKSLLDAIKRAPHDDGLRQVYGDWLEEHGYAPEAELISLEREIRAGGTAINEHELDRLGYRLRTIAETLPTSWRVLVARPLIERCNDARFELTCPKAWDGVSATDNPFVRSCNVCSKHVYFAPTIEIARQYANKGQCVAVDIAVARHPRDLDVDAAPARAVAAAAVTGPVTPSQEPRLSPPLRTPDDDIKSITAVTELSFFATAQPPRTVGELLQSLEVTAPEMLGRGNDMGSFFLPAIDAYRAATADADDDPPVLSKYVHHLSFRYAWDVYHQERSERLADISSTSIESFSIYFSRDGAAIDAWLCARLGSAPREVMSKPAYKGDAGRLHRIFGKSWLLCHYGQKGTTCELEWHDKLPEWALPPTNSTVTVQFVSELVDVLRQGASYDEVKSFAGRPPAHSGVVVTGPLNNEDFWLSFEPKVPALDFARALGIATPVGTSGDVHMSSWSLAALDDETTNREPLFGDWTAEANLDGSPSGEWLENHYACKRVTEKDRVRSFVIRRPRKR